jgi:catechol 2,3-dioxygenase-like lactoylglutathione lyase family enzyme
MILAEVGFYTDILGLSVNALDPGYAMFTSPGGDFFIAIVPTLEGTRSTPPDAIRIQFMVADVFATAKELERRGISLEQWPQPCALGSSLYIGFFRTPHGICVDLWGQVEVQLSTDLESPPVPSISTESEVSEVFTGQDEEEAGDFDVEVDMRKSNEQLSSEQDDERIQENQVEPEELLEAEYVDEESA